MEMIEGIRILKKLERQKVDLCNAKKDAKEGIAIVRDLDKGLRFACAERNEARMQVATLQAEIKKCKRMLNVCHLLWKKDNHPKSSDVQR
jgi:hypothetical protein